MECVLKSMDENKLTVFIKKNSVDEVTHLKTFGNKGEKKGVAHTTFSDKYYLAKLSPFNNDVSSSQFRCYSHTSIALTFL